MWLLKLQSILKYTLLLLLLLFIRCIFSFWKIREFYSVISVRYLRASLLPKVWLMWLGASSEPADLRVASFLCWPGGQALKCCGAAMARAKPWTSSQSELLYAPTVCHQARPTHGTTSCPVLGDIPDGWGWGCPWLPCFWLGPGARPWLPDPFWMPPEWGPAAQEHPDLREMPALMAHLQ